MLNRINGAVLLITTLVGACGTDRIQLTTGMQSEGASETQGQGGSGTLPGPETSGSMSPGNGAASGSPNRDDGGQAEPNADGGDHDHQAADAGFSPLPECSLDRTCPDDFPLCDLERGLCMQCSRTRHCPQSYACSREGRCVPGCGSDGDCGPSRPECHWSRCVECSNDIRCWGTYGPSRSVCDDHECRACQSDDECPSGACVDGVCVFDAARPMPELQRDP